MQAIDLLPAGMGCTRPIDDHRYSIDDQRRHQAPAWSPRSC